MFVEITQRGKTRLLRRLAPHETHDPTPYADAWCQRVGLVRSKESGHIPSGCATHRCEIRRTKAPSPVIWAALDFFVCGEGATP